MMERRVQFFFLISLLFILGGTLFPFNFSLANKLSIQEIILGFHHISNPGDFFANILLFIPFGFCFAWSLNLQGIREIKGVAFILIASLSLSTSIEILQLLLPHRFSTKSDIVANSLGGLLGSIIFILFYLCWLISSSKRHQILLPKRLVMPLLSYFTLAICLTLSLVNTTTLSNWDRNFPLVIGNEATGNRPWNGYIAQLMIFDRALPKKNIQRFLNDRHFTVKSQDSLIAAYRLSGEANYRDFTGHLPVLSWKKNLGNSFSERLNTENVRLTPRNWLTTSNSPSLIAEKITQTSQFTIYTTVATNALKQTGPARIISLSKNPNQRNFTIAQQNHNLVFRMRNLLMGKNGANFELAMSNAFQNTDYHRIAVSYGDSTIKIYVDKQDNFSSWKLMPEANLFQHFFSTNSEYREMLGYKLLYYLIVFIPLGLVLGLFSLVGQRKFINYASLSMMGIIAIVTILQSLLAYGNKTNLSPTNYCLSIAIAVTTFFIVKSGILFKNDSNFNPIP